jgi:ELWxxDGT repeat protein
MEDLGSFEGFYESASLVAIAEDVFFATYDESGSSSSVWRSHRGGKPQLVHRFTHRRSYSGFIDRLLPVGSTLFFTVEQDGFGRELWRSDGTLDGTVMVSDLNPGPADGAHSVALLDGRIFFIGDDGQTGAELWTSDGSAAGTTLVKDIRPGMQSGITSGELATIHGLLTFAADDGEHGSELWRSDGSDSGTFQVDEIVTGALGSSPAGFASAGRFVFFSADDGVTGRELWKIPGAALGASCAGDCNQDFEVSIDELMRGVALALSPQPPSTCDWMDATRDGSISIDELIRAVDKALQGCP